MDKLFFSLLPALLTGVFVGIMGLFLAQILLNRRNLKPLLDQQLDELVETFQKEIPMASMFLKGKMVDTLKGRAEDKILGGLPGAKRTLFKKYGLLWMVSAALIGLIMGLLSFYGQ